MKIEINEYGIVYCDGKTCDPIAMFDSYSECGGCPFTSLFEGFLNVWLDGGC